MVKRIVLLVILAVLAFSLVGCQTVKGVGRDITAVGEFGEKVVDKD
jgi:predicted small secreted protein